MRTAVQFASIATQDTALLAHPTNPPGCIEIRGGVRKGIGIDCFVVGFTINFAAR